MFVLDTSLTAAWFFPDEVTEYTDRMLRRLRETSALVPIIWPLEVANTLLVGERRQRLTEAQTARLVQFLQELPIRVAEGVSLPAMVSLLALGRQHALSVYDASYLALAMREGLPLATRDDRLRAAAESAGVPLAE